MAGTHEYRSAQLFEESLKEIETRPGSIVRGVVVAIDKDVVLVDAGLKSESANAQNQGSVFNAVTGCFRSTQVTFN
ncbi:hypothetical protein ACUOCP_52100, partial [Escherichia sp. R-CC3]